MTTFTALAKLIFGSANDRFLRRLNPIVEQINSKEQELEGLSDNKLKARTSWLKKRLKNGEKLDDVLVDAFATVREASKRTLGMRHFDVQLLGGIVLHKGMVAEMKTGEGKTLVATLPVYLNALTSKGVHVVTVNDYLALRDAEWMQAIYSYLGMSVGCISNALDDDQRRDAYNADITYGTNNEFGFDYLRENMKFRIEDLAQRPFNYAIVDEVDNILIDEARTPLIISGAAEESSKLYRSVDKIIPDLNSKDYEKDEKANAVTLTEKGTQRIEKILEGAKLLNGNKLYDINNVTLVHHVNQALRAHTLFQRDKDYIVKDDQIIIIDEFTGRMMEGRRYSEGLHQALEAKENVTVQLENQTLASITFQNFFRLYPKLAGMTGTAETEAQELSDIYKLEVMVIPTNVTMVRNDSDDEVYRTAREKNDAILKLIKECQERKQPVLVGTTSIEKSEYLSCLMKKSKIPHNVLNARYHEKEAEIISQAGIPGAVTIATNMAGRGTDIKLGGNCEMRIKIELSSIADKKKQAKQEEKIKKETETAEKVVLGASGLYVIGTERHESRRIDNQLRGRSGRQGDPGKSKFFLSLEDDLMRIFGSERLDNMLKKLGIEEGEAITHPWVNKAIERAQQKVEVRNYDIRKQLLKYDDVMNDQRKVIYEQRRDLMKETDIHEAIEDMRKDTLEDMTARFIPEKAYANQWNVDALHEECLRIYGLDLPISDWAKEEGIVSEEIKQRIIKISNKLIADKEEKYGTEMMRVIEKTILLRLLDQNWKDHLRSLDQLRQGIHLRAYAQRNPLNEYKGEAFSLFEEMLDTLRISVTQMLSHLTIADGTQGKDISDVILEGNNSNHGHFLPGFLDGVTASPTPTEEQKQDIKAGIDMFKGQRVRRNDPCYCGSKKRYKHCHGR